MPCRFKSCYARHFTSIFLYLSALYKEDIMPVDDETEELWKLAKETPSKYEIMTIKNTETGYTIYVDQSMDSMAQTSATAMQEFIKGYLDIYLHFRDKKYDGYLDGHHEVLIGKLLFNFGRREGEIAHRWMLKYITNVLKMFDQDKLINLKKLEEIYDGQYNKTQETAESGDINGKITQTQ